MVIAFTACRQPVSVKMQLTPAPTAVIKITFGEIPADPVTVTGSTTVSVSGSLQISVNNAQWYDSFEWWLNENRLPAVTGSVYTFQGSLGPGRHTVMAVVRRAGVPFSKSLFITVMP